MKKIFILFAVASSMAACKQKKQTPAYETMVLSATDSTELKEFRDWKALKEKEATLKTSAAQTVVYNNNEVAPAATAAKTKKKKWSKAAKGAVIGAGTGAVAGAVINKRNRAAGAAVGAVIGGGAGYGIGRAMDKKDGRY